MDSYRIKYRQFRACGWDRRTARMLTRRALGIR